MIRIKDIIHSLARWAPAAYAEGYDNPGLLTGHESLEVSGVLVSLDCVEAVVDEAIAKGCNLIISHHPIWFGALKSLTGKNYVERTLLKAIKNDIALFAIHTNLDNVKHGVNNRIAERLNLQNRKILQPKSGMLEKVVFFVPKTEAGSVKESLFSAGAGKIGEYDRCSFEANGVGQFRPSDCASPSKGQAGFTERVDELRVEMMYAKPLRQAVITQLKLAHPYEEVSYFIHALENENQDLGSGMIGELPRAMPFSEFLIHLKSSMDIAQVRHTADHGRTISNVALCGGAGSFLTRRAITAGADVFVTADVKYHEFFDADRHTIIADIGHYESERFTIDLIADFLREKFSTFATHLTDTNTNPIHYS